jgi:hypothetical protein
VIHLLEPASVVKHEAHCIAWATATAAMWGIAEDHDLDEPVRLTKEVPVRIRWVDARRVIIDRAMSLHVTRTGRNAMLRLTSSNGKFFETEVRHVAIITAADRTVEIAKCF